MRLEDPSGKPLWGYAGDEIFLGSDLPKRKSKRNEQFYFPKIFHEDSRGLRRVALENSPRPYAGLADDAVLDTQDVARKAGCSPLTVLRHANAKRLKIHPKSSLSQFYYKKRDVDVWLENESEFKRGRPRKESLITRAMKSDRTEREVKANDKAGTTSRKRPTAGSTQGISREAQRRSRRRRR